MIKFSPLVAAAAVVGTLASPAAVAGAEPFIGEVILVGYNFCPRGFADADGQLLAISSNTALFSLYGTTYGGDGRTTFGLPDLRGRTPVHEGNGPGLSPVMMGEKGGREQASLGVHNLPSHTHGATMAGTAASGDTDNPSGAVPARLPRSRIYSSGGGSDAAMATTVTVGSTGGGQPVEVRSPFLGMRYCVALQGLFPSRS